MTSGRSVFTVRALGPCRQLRPSLVRAHLWALGTLPIRAGSPFPWHAVSAQGGLAPSRSASLCVPVSTPPPLTFSSFAPVPSALVGCPPGKRNSLLSWLSGNEARLEDVHCHLSPEPASCRCINLSQQALGPPPPPPPGTCAPHPRPFTGVGQPDRCWFCLTWASVLLCPFAQVLEGFP